MGRDVVGFRSSARHEEDWDNYQCKQYRGKVGTPEGILAVGKIFYWAAQGYFTVPRAFYFVAPNGVNTNLLALINKPSLFRQTLIDDWGKYCSKKIIAKSEISMDDTLKAAIESFDFGRVRTIDVDEMLEDPAVIKLLVEKFGDDPGAYPKAVVPLEVQPEELAYLEALVDAYNEREPGAYGTHADILAHASHGSDLRTHRERYFEADGFQKFYRDNTPPEVIDNFRRDIHFGVRETLRGPAPDQLARVDAVMLQAATITPAGPLANHAHIPVKQGMCHHLVSDGVIGWKKPQ